MIIDDVSEPLLKDLPSPHARPEPDLPPSPPPYVSYQAIIPPPVLAPRRKSRQRLGKPKYRRKYFVAASIALNCLFLLLWIRASGEESDASRTRNGSTPNHPGDVEIPSQPIRAVVPDPTSGRCVQNVTWANATRLAPEEDHFPFSSEASFDFQDPSALLFLLSQGALSGGRLDVLPSKSLALPRAVLRVRYHLLDVRNRANVCLMERKHAGGIGIGIFTPPAFDAQTPEDNLDFTITLFLPTRQRHAGSSLPVYNLETQLPSFTHSLDSLRDVLEFDTLVLRSKNEPIVAKSLFARNATIQTSNGFISGSFEASSSLSLVTSNAPIDATVKLHNTNIFSTTELILQTRNGQIDSDVSLMTSAATGEGGKFSIKAETSDAPLVMTFPASPARSILNLDAQTSNSPASVWLNHAFEGDFALASSVIFVDRRPFLDPKRLRSVLYGDYKNGMIVGNVRWKLPVFKSKVLGKVRVATTNNILKLYV
ncbi:hypothetical protein C8F04DRAFT_1396379 [Mycena alexandri]|uniref:Uncharacterized protein n=1 Tax=Mycena alexandri TaxID=1745969 RepID=A0AAD6SS61_9AGAR|nr:hypothetical protein C8F04DRAFT_1396379 [Mycena alexandri]